ncbi:MAG: hypothetical protein GSR73_02915 [Desulfurococcales archaeon]|nr:hypothetical protein [Desulfurococcales archaeon]
MRKGRLVILLIGVVMIATAIIVFSGGEEGYRSVSSLAGADRPVRVTIEGTVTDYWITRDNKQVVFVLSDGKASIIAYYSLEEFIGLHGRKPGDWMIGQQVVVQGTFYPHRMGEYLGYIEISQMLKGCHEGYKAPQVNS